jgi:UDP-N-acetylglucosamine--N-acetylmuramyl-(pentapeptide) pyrophosphoryl-undecaprenol N-acetylglucosamine transferase
VIFVSVGTLHFPFDRLMAALHELPLEQLVVQHGPAEPPRGVREAASFMPLDEMLARIEAADAVVTHAGVGSIYHATHAGHVPVVVPRLERFGEHVDDHQLELARLLAAEGKVIAVTDVAELPRALANVPPRGPARGVEPGRLHSAVRSALTD